MSIQVQHFFDSQTGSLTYILSAGCDALVIDPVLNLDLAAGKISYESCEELLGHLRSNKLNLLAILETHVHADHLSGSQYLKQNYPEAKICISNRITEVQKLFFKVFNLSGQVADGSQFDLLLEDQKEYSFGELLFKVLPTPGHTPACTSFLFDHLLFTGDSLFMPSAGTGRCDFPMGSASELFDSIQALYSLPDETIVYVGHNYPPEGQAAVFQSTIGESKLQNIHIKKDTKKEDFIQFREQRDKTLSAPKLLLPSLQVNTIAGRVPFTEANGTPYLKIPLTLSSN